jgi:hypothetical protein
MTVLAAKIGKPTTWLMLVIIILFSFAHSLQGKDYAHKTMRGIKVEIAHASSSASFENHTRSQKVNTEESIQATSEPEHAFAENPIEEILLAKPFIDIHFYERHSFYVHNSHSAP